MFQKPRQLIYFIATKKETILEYKKHVCRLSVFIPFKSIIETCSVVLTFESVDKILWCDHSNETSLAVLSHGTICFSVF